MATRRIRHDVQALVDKLAPGVRAAFLLSIADVKSSAQMAVIVGAIERGDTEAVFQALSLGREFFAPLDDALRAAYLQGGAAALAGLPPIPGPFRGARVVARFDGRNPRAEDFLARQSSSLVTAITTEQRDVVRDVVRGVLTAGMEASRSPRAVALDLVGRIDTATGRRAGGVIGLSERDARYVASARAELRDPARMANYLTRTRRDRRFDSAVKAAMREGRAVPEADVAKLVARYEARLLVLRGDTIARTELLASLHEAQDEGLRQMYDRGALRPEQVTREWDAAGDKNTRPTHRKAHGQTVGADEPFMVGGYEMMHPGDGDMGAPAEETVNCRCRVRVTIDFLDGIR